MERNKIYGKKIEKMLAISGQKNYMLANVLGYNETYISKWIKGSRLPSPKSVIDINKNISKFIVDNLDKERIKNIVKIFDMNIEENDENIYEIIKENLETILNDAFKNDYMKKDKNNNSKNNDEEIENNNNGVINISPKYKKDYLVSLVISKTETKDIEIFVVANLFSLSYNDKLHISGFDDYFYINKRDYTTTIKFLINFENYKYHNKDEFIFNVILLLNMITVQENIKFEFFTHKFPPNTLLSVAKDIYMHHALFNNQGNCIITSTSTDIEIVNNTYNYIEDMREYQSYPTFYPLTSEEMITDKYYSKILMNGDFNILLGEMDELFMTESIFNEIAQNVFDNDITMEELKRIYKTMNKISLESKSKLILNDRVIKKFLETGKVKFFNETIYLNKKERIEYIENMLKCIKEKDIEVLFCKNDKTKGFYLFEEPSLYIYHNDVFLKKRQDNKYLFINDSLLKTVLINFFNSLWGYENEDMIKDKNDIIRQLNKILNIFIKI